MTILEFLLEVQSRTPEEGTGAEVYAGGLTLGQIEELEAWANQ
jgi:hypothetical protein